MHTDNNELKTNKRNNPEYSELFDDLIREVFGFSFKPWLKRGLWDERYESYSIIRNGKMLSNVCVFKTEMATGEKRFRAIQFGAVATRSGERGKGYSKYLMEHVLSIYPDTPAFLFANPSVIDFYPRFGFRQVQTYKPVIDTVIENTCVPAIKLNPDDSLVQTALMSRLAHSFIVDCLNTQPVQMFHLLLDYADCIYHLPESDVIVVADREGSLLTVVDVIARSPVTFDELVSELPFHGVRQVEFGFCPDRLAVIPKWVQTDSIEEPFFLRGEWSLPLEFRFPAMSAT